MSVAVEQVCVECDATVARGDFTFPVDGEFVVCCSTTCAGVWTAKHGRTIVERLNAVLEADEADLVVRLTFGDGSVFCGWPTASRRIGGRDEFFLEDGDCFELRVVPGDVYGMEVC